MTYRLPAPPTYTTVADAINALDDVYRSVRAELTRLLEKA
ncbi:hypothetical protein LITTLEE_62 [Mycobacterium phage LittleE]|nr:hypothetical protein FGG27_gp062 [Mycobacterium phage LittleE]AEK09445.1 hypothetical protein LITTLEE_62 [Mycobacterium phage LittleE]